MDEVADSRFNQPGGGTVPRTYFACYAYVTLRLFEETASFN
jgi:hypothetical protein